MAWKHKVYCFKDGSFRFWTAFFGSWTGEKVVVFRVKEGENVEDTAVKKGLSNWKGLFPSHDWEIVKWLEEQALLTTEIHDGGV